MNLTLTDKEIKRFFVLLDKLSDILINAGFEPQALILKNLKDLLSNGNVEQFVKIINGVDVFGGSGAVWEVYIIDKKLSQEFEAEMVNLINLMEMTNIMGKGIAPIRKIFIKNSKL